MPEGDNPVTIRGLDATRFAPGDTVTVNGNTRTVAGVNHANGIVTLTANDTPLMQIINSIGGVASNMAREYQWQEDSLTPIPQMVAQYHEALRDQQRQREAPRNQRSHWLQEILSIPHRPNEAFLCKCCGEREVRMDMDSAICEECIKKHRPPLFLYIHRDSRQENPRGAPLDDQSTWILHNSNGPAVITLSGCEWRRDGEFHRSDGPAINYSDRQEWWVNGQKHRLEGPAVIEGENPRQNREWWLNGRLHNDTGPAIHRYNGYMAWYKAGKLHRKDGPALIDQDGRKRWYIEGLEGQPIVKRGSEIGDRVRALEL
jgi:hypothetical protein